eukprot:m.16429 g.16429  ORF g.16429 m.16429 type:complete len:833 (-) comp5697_c0_seq1:163-2661(-)
MDVQQPTTRTSATIDTLAATVKKEFSKFLQEYILPAEENNGVQEEDPHYKLAVDKMKDLEFTTLYIDCKHVASFNPDLVTAIQDEFLRLEPYLKDSLREFVLSFHEDYEKDDKEQVREFYVAFYNVSNEIRIRDLKTARIGTLVAIKGTVVRTQMVHPELINATFQCKECKTLNPNIEQQFRYTEPNICRSPACGNKKEWKLITDQSRFVDFQRIRMQESSDEIPSGSMPRSVDIVVRHELVEQAKAGDKALITGTLIVIPDVAKLSGSSGRLQMSTRGPQRNGYSQEGVTGLQSLGVRDLPYRLAFLASTVVPTDNKQGLVNVRDELATAENVVAELTEAEREELIAMKDDPKIYDKIANSIAPTVFGHEEIKRGVALMLFGGVHKTTQDGINLRGDINVCLVGDPATSKSQFLKYVVEFVPRAVYTSGKASTAAGLTAAVVKDEDSKDFFIEAGALMLADNGICCIDEFDKMDTKDQVAIHEAMEQQTISISKAGVQATLNARASVLAAANPVHGRYDRSRSLKANVNMTAPIMSRFDLFFVVVDECNDVADYNIARHITSIHRFQDEAIKPDYTTAQLQRYIRFARTLKPKITPEAQAVMVKEYKKLRQSDVSGLSKSSYRITVRQLESMIRLSEALARLKCDDVIKPEYVHEACRLLRKSIVHVDHEDIDLGNTTLLGAIVKEGDEKDDKKPDDTDATSKPDKDGTETEDDEVDKPAVTIPFEKYTKIANMLIRRLRQLEGTAQEKADGTKKRLKDWYIHEIEDELQSEEDFHTEVRVVHLVMHRMITVDGVLLELNDFDDESKAAVDDEDSVVVVHPNYEMESGLAS